MLKFVTFNIRCDYNQDKDNSFCFRKQEIEEKLEREQPDIICFQEVLPHVAIWLKETLRDYYVVGCGRSRELDGEQVAIAFKYKSFNMISMETFWLSPDCFLPGSRYAEQSECPRVCTELVLEDLSESGGKSKAVGAFSDFEKTGGRKIFCRYSGDSGRRF